MALVVTWRNLFRSVRAESNVRRVLQDRFGTHMRSPGRM
jgi:hypothetical protein